MNDRSGVYQIRNIETGALYIGSSEKLNYRWKQHLRMLRAGRHHSPKLQAAFEAIGGPVSSSRS